MNLLYHYIFYITKGFNNLYVLFMNFLSVIFPIRSIVI